MEFPARMGVLADGEKKAGDVVGVRVQQFGGDSGGAGFDWFDFWRSI